MMSARSRAAGSSSSRASVRSLGSRNRVHHFVALSLRAVTKVVSLAVAMVVILPGCNVFQGQTLDGVRPALMRCLAQYAAQAAFHLGGAFLRRLLTGKHGIDRGADDVAHLVV